MKVPISRRNLPYLRRALRGWYERQGRSLAIRGTRDAWSLLVAETMAQQTQVARVDPAWRSFMAAFPRPIDLAGASTADVLRAWAGLGYNRRAIALQQAARLIVERHEGEVPSSVDLLMTLPGVGPYTARAVAATAFGQPWAAVDTNVRRVVVRLWADEDVPAAMVQARADELLDPSDPALWTHAVMDLGATVCRPVRPDHAACPIARWCGSADRVATTARPRHGAAPFDYSSRWLRGRIVADLRDVQGDAWTTIASPFGPHAADAVADAVMGLERDGLLERAADGRVRLPR